MSSENIKQIPGQTPSPLERAGVRIKICGMKHPANITEIAALQPEYLGFIFYEKSSRFFNGNMPQLPQGTKKVGVFVNASMDEILEKVETYSLDVVQLHGEESPEFCSQLKRHFEENIDNVNAIKNERLPCHASNDSKIDIVKVFSIKDHFNFDQLQPYELVCDYFLFDTKGKLPGGNGYTFNWDVLKNYPSTKPYFLSGGIGLEETDNITAFLQGNASKYCYAIDVNSKFESEPGLKDLKILKEFKNKIKPNLTSFENL
ncbi:phosphoribosylanthranilate isomerase [Gelidibacter algens]|uniref:N-(5'-phosphoribosyl)anthranilate isomerase n=2 Tax=Gelidibacter algens TaxID=49280 RepID=A0A327RYQ6_9FLAO|nr:phosphoribosylanthranilate isomerase [Gelidibacter algens]